MKSPAQPGFAKVCILALMLVSYTDTYVFGAPKGGQVVAGSGSISQNGNLTVVTAGNRSIINYQSFNIGSSETVKFVQPSSSSTVLNRVLSPDPTNIFGQIQANGNVVIANPYGVFFQNGSVINVGGLYAGAGKISDQDFSAGRIRFTDLAGDVRNDGVIAADNRIALMGANVVNNGTLNAARGMAMMVSGKDVFVGERNGNIFVKANGGAAPNAAPGPGGSIVNRGSVKAPQVLLGAGDMYSTAIANSGLLQGRRIAVDAGRNGSANIGGRLDASSAANGARPGKGGAIQVTGGQVALQGATVDASGANGGGSVRIGGDFHGGGKLAHATTTTVDATSTIKADATGAHGNGGTVVLWSDAATDYSGQVSARGGASSGDGGQVEISSRGVLGYHGKAEASAPAGRPGTLLLDPSNIIIQAGNTAPNADTTVLLESTVESMDPNTDTIITATDDLRIGDLGDNRLDFAAGTGSVTLNANGGGVGTGTFVVGTPLTTSIFTNGRALTINAGTTPSTLNPETYGIQTGPINTLGSSNGAVTLNTAGTINLAGAINAGSLTTTGSTAVSISAPTITTVGAQSYAGQLSLATDVILSGSALGVSSLLGNNKNLTLAFQTPVAVSNAIYAGLNNFASSGVVDLTGDFTTAGSQTYGAELGVSATSTLTTSNPDPAGGAITFGAVLTSPNGSSLTTATAGGSTIFGAGSGSAPGALLSSLTTSAIGSTIFNHAAFTTGDSQIYQGDVIVGQSASKSLSLTSQNAVIRFDKSLTATAGLPSDLSLSAPNGAVTFGGPVGGALPASSSATALNSLTVTSPTITLNGGLINTASTTPLGGAGDGDQIYNGAVSLGAATTFVGRSVGSAGALSVAVNGFDLTLTLSGLVTVPLAGYTGIGNFTSNGAGGADIAGDFTVSGFQHYDNAATLSAPAVLTGSDLRFSTVTSPGTPFALSLQAGGTILLNGAVGGGGAPLQSLTIGGGGAILLNGGAVTTTGAQAYNNAVVLGAAATALNGSAVTFALTLDGASALSVNAGTTTFGGLVGATPLLSLTTDAAGTTFINGGGVTTTGAQTYNDAVVLGAATTALNGSAVTFALTLDGASALSVTAGTTTFGGLVGATPLSSLTTDAVGTTFINGGGVTTTGAQTYNDAVILGAATTALNGSAVRFALTLDGASALSVNAGTTTFGGLVGATPLSSLTTDAAGTTFINGGGVTTTGAQTYNDAVVLGAAATTLNGSAVTFVSTLDGTSALSINAGTTTFGGLVGATPLSSLTTDAAGTTFINGGGVTTTGAQTYNDAVVLGAATTVLNGSAVRFALTLDGVSALTINAGTTTFGGFVGATPLSSLTTDAAGTTFINSGGVTTTGAQTYNDAVVLGAASTVLNGSAVRFALTLDGASALSINAGATTFGGLVGATPLSSLTTDAAGTTFINGGGVTTTGAQTYNDAVVLGAATTVLNGSAVTFVSTLDGASALTINAGTTTFGGLVGATPLLSLTTDAAGTTFINGGGVTTTGAQTYNDAVVLGAATTVLNGSTVRFAFTLDGASALSVNAGTTIFGGLVGATPLSSLTTDAAGTTFINGGGVTTTGAQTYNDAVVLGAATTVLNGSAVRFALTLDGASALSINAGTTTFGGLVGATPLLSLTTDAAGTTFINGGGVTTTGAQTYNDAVVLGAATTVLNGSAVTFILTLDGASALSVNAGTTIFGGLVGATPLSSLTTDAAGTTFINGGGVTTTGAQTYNDAVVLGAATTALNGSAVTFASTLDGSSALTINAGTTTFGGFVGATPLTSLTTDAAGTTFINGGGVTTTGAQTYNDAVVLGAASTVLNGSAVRFALTLDGASALSINAGTTTFGGLVGATPLTSLTTDATGTTFINGGGVTTTGAQTYNDAVVLGAATTVLNGSAVTFASTLDGASALTINAGTTTFGGLVGTTPLTSLTTDATGTTFINGGGVTTTGAQTYNDAVVLGAAATTLNGSAVTFASTLDGASALSINAGTTIFGGLVGTTPLLSLTTDAAGTTFINGGGVTTTGAQTYNDAVVLGAVTTVLNGSTVRFALTLDGASALSVNAGTTIFGGLVGATPLTSLTTDAAGTTFINGGGVTTTGAQTYNDAVVLGAATTALNGSAVTFVSTLDGASALSINAGTTIFGGLVGATPLSSLTTDAAGTTFINGGGVTTTGAQTYNDAVVLGAATTVLNGSAVRFALTLDGASALSVNAGTTTFGGLVGATPLLSLATDAAGTTFINGGGVTTTGAQTYNDAVVLGAASTVLNGSAVTFVSTLDGASALTINAGTTTIFGGLVGATPLLSLTTDAVGTTFINGGGVTTTGAQTYNDAVVLGAATTVLNGSAVRFALTLDGASALSINAGTTTFGGLVGTTPLLSLTTDAAGTTFINGGGVTTTGAQTYNDSVVLGAATTVLNGSAVTFASTLDGASALTINAGTTIFGGLVGTTPLTSLTTDAAGTTFINGGGVTTTGAQTYNDAVVLGAATTVLNGNAVRFVLTLDGASALTINAAATTFGGLVGATPLLSLTTDAAGTTFINGGRVTTTGAQTYNDAVVLGAASTTLNGSAVTFASTLDGASALTINAGTTTFNQLVGNNTPLTSLINDAAGQTHFNMDASLAGAGRGGVNIRGGAVTINDAAFFNVAGSSLDHPSLLTLNDTTPGLGAQTYNASVTLQQGVTVLASRFAGGASTGGAITFNGLVDSDVTGGARSLTVEAGAGQTVFAPGATVTANSLDIGGAQVVFNRSVGSAQRLNVLTVLHNGAGNPANPPSIDLNGGSVTTAGAQRYRDPVFLSDNTLLTASDVTFDSTVDGTVDRAFALTINASNQTVFNGLVGNVAALTDLTTDQPGETHFNMNAGLAAAGRGGVTLSGALSVADRVFFKVGGSTAALPSILTAGSQTYAQAASLQELTVLRAGGTSGVSFLGTVNGGFDLTVDSAGLTTFAKAVGNNVALTSLTTDAAGRTLLGGGAVTSSGAQTYLDPVTLGDKTLLSASDVTFDATLDGAFALTINASNQTVFNGLVGNVAALTDLTTDQPGETHFNMNAGLAAAGRGGVTLSGALLVADRVFFKVGGSTVALPSIVTAGSQTYAGPALLQRSTFLTTGGASNLSFLSMLDGAFDLAINSAGATTFSGAAGAGTALASLVTDGPGTTVFNQDGRVITAGLQTYGDAVQLGVDTTLTSTAKGDIAFGKTVDGAFALSVNTSGFTFFNGAVGAAGGGALASLTTDAGGGTAINGGSVTTRGSQSYGDAVTLGIATTLSATNASGARDIVFHQTLGGAVDLAINTSGSTIFDGAIGSGAAAALNSLTTDQGGTTIFDQSGGVVVTTNGQTYNDAVTLRVDATFSSGNKGDITFGNTLTGPNNGIVLNTKGATNFNGAVTLASLLTDAGGTTNISGSGSITTSGPQTYKDLVNLSIASTFKSDGDITFDQTVNGRFALTLDAGGLAVFNGAVGQAKALASLTTTGRGETKINGGLVATTGGQIYGNAVTLGNSTALTSENADGKGINFTRTLRGAVDLDLDNAGETRFGGNVSLSNLAIRARGNTSIATPAITTAGSQTYGNPVSLASDTTLNGGGSIRFGQTLDGARTLTLGAGGSAIFEGQVGGRTALRSLITGPNGTTVINGGAVKTTVSQFYGNGVEIGGDARLTSLDSSGNGTLTFKRDVRSTGRLTVDAHRVLAEGNIEAGGDLDFETPAGTEEQALILLTGTRYVSSQGRLLFNINGANAPGANNVSSTIVLSHPGLVNLVGAGFEMGARQKLLALGALDINVGRGTAIVGDLAARDTLTISAAEVDLLARAAQQNTRPGTLNNGLNIVAINAIEFGDARVVIKGDPSNPRANFITSNGLVNVQRVTGITLLKEQRLDQNQFVRLAGFSVDRFNAGASGPDQPVDGGGAQSLDTAAALAGALPDQKPLDVKADAAISTSQLDQLTKLGIHGRRAQRIERNSNQKRALFAQLVDGNDADNYGRLQPIKGGISTLEPSDYAVVVDRMGVPEVQTLLKSFEDLYGKDNAKKTAISKAFQTALDDSKATDSDADQFSAYVLANPGKYPEVDAAVKGYDDLFGQIEHLGLTDKEIAKSEEHIVVELLAGLSPENTVKQIKILRDKLPPSQKAPSNRAPKSAPVRGPAPGEPAPSAPPAPKPTLKTVKGASRAAKPVARHQQKSAKALPLELAGL